MPEVSTGSSSSQSLSHESSLIGAPVVRSEASAPVRNTDTDTDRTVISEDAPIHRHPVGILRNTANGQEIPISATTLLGRKPSKNVPAGMKVAVLTDSTRTVSRNHAVVSVASDGSMTLRDLGSLNGTYVIDRGNEVTVGPDAEVPLAIGVTLRIGDEFYAVDPGESDATSESSVTENSSAPSV